MEIFKDDGNEPNEQYFYWLVDLVDDGTGYIWDYESLLRILYEEKFEFDNPLDDNRRLDALDLRDQFASENPVFKIKNRIDCSILEMMVALACRCDHDIMGEPGENSAFLWFRVMLDNSGWENLSDEILFILFSENEKQDLGNVLWPLKHPISGDIWAKMNCFLVENPKIGMN